MSQLFIKRDPWGNSQSLWIVVLFAFVAPLCVWSIRQIPIDSSIEKSVAASVPELTSLNWVRQQFHSDEQLLLTWDESSLNDPRLNTVITNLAGTVDASGTILDPTPGVASVIDPVTQLNQMRQNGIETQEAIRRLEGTVLGAGPLRLRLTDAGRASIRKTKKELQTALQARLKVDVTVKDASSDLLSQVAVPAAGNETAATHVVLAADGSMTEKQTIEHDLQVTWTGLQLRDATTIETAKWLTEYSPPRGDNQPLVEQAFFAPGTPIAVVVTLSEAGLADKSEAVVAIRAACHHAGIASETLHLAGHAIQEIELNKQASTTLWNSSASMLNFHQRSPVLASLLVMVLLAFVVLRPMWTAASVSLMSLLVIGGALSTVSLAGGAWTPLLVILPVTLVALSLSIAIPAARHFQKTSNHDNHKSFLEAIGHSRMPSLLAGLIAACCLISLGISAFMPLRAFGIAAAAGLVLAVPIMTHGLPAFLHIGPYKSARHADIDPVGWRFFGKQISNHAGLQSLGVLAICVGCGLGLTRLQIDSTPLHQFPHQSAVVNDCTLIESTLAGTAPVDLVVRFDEQSQQNTTFLDRMETIRQVQNSLRNVSGISGSTSLADFYPVNDRLPADAGFALKSKYNKRALAAQQRVQDGELPCAKSFYTIAEQAHDLTTAGDGKLNLAGDELWRIQISSSLTATGSPTAQLAELSTIAQQVLKLQPGSQHVITGSLPLQIKIQNSILRSCIGCTCLALFLMTCVNMIGLSSGVGGVLSLIPSVVPLVMVLGVSSWLGFSFDLTVAIASVTALALSAAGTGRYVRRVQSLMKHGQTRHEAITDALIELGPAIWQISSVIIPGSLVLLYAQAPAIVQFSAFLAAMFGASLITQLVFVPQLVAGPLGRFFEPSPLALVKPTIAVQLETPITEPTIAAPAIAASVPEPEPESTIPAPHIAKTAAPKKRRSSKRDLDAS